MSAGKLVQVDAEHWEIARKEFLEWKRLGHRKLGLDKVPANQQFHFHKAIERAYMAGFARMYAETEEP